MCEHWTLIISKPETENIDSFRVGDFHSVFLEDAVKRLKFILGEHLEQTTIDNFKALGEHRNQIVHFAHSNYPDLSASKAKVVVEQWSSWHHLHSLLTVRWKDVFVAYQEEFSRIHDRMMQQKDFILARYEELKQKIDQEKKSGKKVVDCQNCAMHSAVVSKEHKWGLDYSCVVCGVSDTAIATTNETLECPNCQNSFKFFDKGLNACPHCGTEIDTAMLIDLCEDKYTQGDDWWEEGAPYIAGCHMCQNERPSVFYIDGLWSCVSCFDRGWQAISCHHCGEFVTGDMETIKHFACYKCEDEAREALRSDRF